MCQKAAAEAVCSQHSRRWGLCQENLSALENPTCKTWEDPEPRPGLGQGTQAAKYGIGWSEWSSPTQNYSVEGGMSVVELKKREDNSTCASVWNVLFWAHYFTNKLTLRVRSWLCWRVWDFRAQRLQLWTNKVKANNFFDHKFLTRTVIYVFISQMPRFYFFKFFFPSDFKLTRYSQPGFAWYPMVVLILFFSPKQCPAELSLMERYKKFIEEKHSESRNFLWLFISTGLWQDIGKNPILAKLTLI